MRIIVIGDNSRYQFLRQLVNMEDVDSRNFRSEYLQTMDVILCCDKKEKLEGLYYSNKIPLNTRIYFPSYYKKRAFSSEFNINDSDKVIYFNEFPYLTDKCREELEKLKEGEKYSQLRVILLLNDRKFIDNDVTTQEDAVHEAMEAYKKMNIACTIYKPSDKPSFLLWDFDMEQGKDSKKYRCLLENARKKLDEFDSDYDLSYELELEDLVNDPNIRTDNIFSYSGLNEANVWDSFDSRAVGFFMKNPTVVNFYSEIYKKYIRNICVWDMERDLSDLQKTVNKEFVEKIKMHNSLVYRGTELEYSQFLNNHRDETIEFSKRIIDFFGKELRNIIKLRTEKNIMKMEVFING
jgi:hypothetical protein